MEPTLLDRVRRDPRWIKGTGIAIVTVLVTAVSSIGQLEHRRANDVAFSDDQIGDPDVPASGVDGEPSDPGAVAGTPDATAPGTEQPTEPGVASPSGGQPRVDAGAGGTPGTRPRPGGTSRAVPDYGLRTQGVTAKKVRVGVSYNVAACGNAGTVEAALGAAVTGDAERALDAYQRHVNDTGGIGGRTLELVVGDDGGGGCPEKALSAARKLVDDEKVFAVIPGLHDVADYAVSRKVPTFVGRDDPESLRRYGANGIGLTQDIEGNLTAWAAFGAHYLQTAKRTPCLLHPERDESGDWDGYEKILVAKMAAHGLRFADVVVYKNDVSTAQQQANTAAARMRAKGCDQVWFMAGNPTAGIFFTQAATQAAWFPQWTFTSYMALADTELGGRLQDQRQWENAIGLSTRVPSGEHPKEGNCKRIYERYYPNDGQGESAYTQVVCALVLSAAEVMRRAEAVTGELTANSLIVGADAITNDFSYDAHVPLDWRFGSPGARHKSKAFSHYTVVDWSSAQSRYLFPAYPTYWEVMGPGRSGGQDLRPLFKR